MHAPYPHYIINIFVYTFFFFFFFFVDTENYEGRRRDSSYMQLQTKYARLIRQDEENNTKDERKQRLYVKSVIENTLMKN